MPPDALLTAAITLATLLALATTRAGPDLIFVTALTFLVVAGVLPVDAALAGFANPGVATIAVLYVVVAGLRETGGVHWIGRHLLGRGGSGQARSLRLGTLRLTAPVTALSALLNNTPVVAMLIPSVRDWSRAVGVPASKLMIPLSYAAILGGTCTLIGTSTNLVVDGLLRAGGFPGLNVLELAWVGVPTALVGVAFLVTLGPRLLPDRQGALGNLEDPREYSVEMTVTDGGPLVGRTIEQAGLRHLRDLYLAEIDRDGRILAAVSPLERLHGGDRLVFVGIVDSVVELQRIRGLQPAQGQVFKLDGDRTQRLLAEAVVSETSPVVGRTIRESRFRNRYGAVVIAVARAGQRIAEKLGDVTLRPGDTLLLEARPSFVQRMRHVRDFYLVSRIDDSHPFRFDRALTAAGILVAMVAVAALGWLSMVEAALLAAVAMLATRSLRADAARAAIDWTVLVTIGAALGVGAAVQRSGLAEIVATWMTDLAGASPYANLVAIYFVTALFSALVTNNAAAVLVFPIGVGVAEGLDVSVVPFAVTIMMAASASFATPIGYQTNLMVYGPGGYRFTDFLRIGVPMTLLTALVALLVIPRAWPF